MLAVRSINKSFGIMPVLKNINFTLKTGEKAGLVGVNGSGKTTLLRILAGTDKPDSGSASYTPASLRLGYLSQSLDFDPAETLGSYLQKMEGDLAGLSQHLQDLAGQLAADPNRDDLQQAYDATLAAIEAAAESQGSAPAMLAAFELDTLPADLPVAALSGGQKTRLGLAGILLSSPQLLLLDEPTNHLDFAMLEWLENWINQSQATILLVSHDRVFLDNTVETILELDPGSHQIKPYPGNYSDYLDAKAEERSRHWQEYSDQQDEIQRLKSAASHFREIARFRKGGKADSGDKFAKGFFANRGLATVKRAKSVEKRIDHLLTDEKVDKPRDSWQMKMEFEGTPASSRTVMALNHLSVGYGETALLSDLDFTIRYGERVVLIGPNGSGKSTLLRTLRGQIPALSGSVRLGASVRPGYMAQEQEDLDPNLTVLETLQKVAALNETAARTLLHKYLFTGDDAFLPLKACSFGMRSRLSLACLVAQGCNFLLLDEPLNHLDLPSRAQFEKALASFEGTILAVVHDRYFMQRLATRVLEISAGELLDYEPMNVEVE